MSKRKTSIFDMAKAIQKKASESPKKNYGSGLVGEHLIVSSYKVASTKDLIGMRYLINKILEERKIQERIKLKKNESNNASIDTADTK